MSQPSTLDEIETLLSNAKSPQDVFATDAEFKHLVVSTHPDKFPSDSPDRERACSLFKQITGWKEWKENPPTVGSYTLAEKLGSGDLSDVFLAYKDGTPYILKQPRTSSCNNLVAKECESLRQLQEQSKDTFRFYFPDPVETFEQGKVRCNVFHHTPNLSTVSQIKRAYPNGVEARHIGWMFKRLLTALGYAHAKGWANCAVLPQHLLFNAENHGLVLLGWIHAVQAGHECRIISKEYKEWYPPEILKTKKPLPASDIYMAAKSMIFLAGGNPLEETMPASIPKPMQAFLRSCLLKSPTMRSGDAWGLHDEFDSLLFELYGPPRFIPLTL